VLKRHPMTDQPCDSSHPYPEPDHGAWIDSTEYGDDGRLPVDRRNSLDDRDPRPVWRLIAASLWGSDCYDTHVEEVAADPILTTHLIVVAVAAYPLGPEGAFRILGYDHAGAGTAVTALTNGGRQAARKAVEALSLNTRRAAIRACEQYLNKGHLTIRLDLAPHFDR
jgi:hypothetical protein